MGVHFGPEYARVKVYFLIHEFGQPCDWPDEIFFDDSLPVIEDRAYGMGLSYSKMPSGRTAEYYLYSLPKAFPVSGGGIYFESDRQSASTCDSTRSTIDVHSKDYIDRLLVNYLAQLDEGIRKRRANDRMFRRCFARFGLEAFFGYSKRAVPHAFLFKFDDEQVGRDLKSYLASLNVESSVYWGCGGYYLPNHPGVGDATIEYLAFIVRSFLANNT